MKTKAELKMEKYAAQLKKIGVPVNKALLEKVTKALGPANYKLDAMFVAASDKKELVTVYKNFVVKKLGCKDE
jgi:small subunit ribosomal protein S1